MWAVGEDCVAAMQFEISGFYSSGGQATAHIFCSDRAQTPFNFFQGVGVNFSTPGGQISILKIIIFLMIFL